jgi:polysaccharide export outer membrane protein
MKLKCTSFVRALLICSVPLVGILIAGCSSATDQPEFSDVPAPSHAMTGSPVAGPDDFEVAHFHVGDTVTVTLDGPPEPLPVHGEQIKEDGTITMPDIGKIEAVGKTAGELQNQIHDLYVPKFYPRLTVTVTTGERVYYVSGEVNGRGSQLYRSEVTVSRGVTAAGGFTDFANHKNVMLIRANGQRIKVNVDRVIAGKATDPAVYPGDQIVVSRRLW